MPNRHVSVSRLAPAKLNLGLHVLHRRRDGYHDLESVLVAIGWCDELHFQSQGGWRFSCTDPSLPTDSRNLCVAAALSLAARGRVDLNGHLHLVKNVPHGGGLGGGSSDAASALQLLESAWHLQVSAPLRHRMAIELGSDVPFFLNRQPAFASGRGELLEPLSGFRLSHPITVIVPAVRVATAEAYRHVSPSALRRPDLRSIVESGDFDRWKRELINDFQEPIEARHAEIRTERLRLEAAGAHYAALSGSGSAVFGIFPDETRAQAAAAEAAARGLQTWSGYALNAD